MRLATLILLAAALPILVTGSVGAAEESDQYMVEMTLWIDGEQRGTPVVIVEPDSPASVEVSDEAGHGGWKIELLVEPPAASEVAPAGATWLNLTIFEQRDGEWEPLADSLLGVREGRTGTMSVVEADGEPATPKNSLVHLSAQVSRLQPGQAPD